MNAIKISELREHDPARHLGTPQAIERSLNAALETGDMTFFAHSIDIAARYDCNRLVWFERFDLITDAIAREKQIKHWKRAWKIDLIEAANPQWADLPLDWTLYER